MKLHKVKNIFTSRLDKTISVNLVEVVIRRELAKASSTIKRNRKSSLIVSCKVNKHLTITSSTWC